ncbi:MAG: hypothetical protein WCP60_07745 [bacterium]
MSRIPTITETTATPEQRAILTAVKKSLGIVANHLNHNNTSQ